MVALRDVGFLLCDAMLARYMLSSCASSSVSARLSITSSWHGTKTAKLRITQTTPNDSSGTLVF